MTQVTPQTATHKLTFNLPLVPAKANYDVLQKSEEELNEELLSKLSSLSPQESLQSQSSSLPLLEKALLKNKKWNTCCGIAFVASLVGGMFSFLATLILASVWYGFSALLVGACGYLLYRTSSNLDNKEKNLTSEINAKIPVYDKHPHLSLLHEIVTNTNTHPVLRKTCALLYKQLLDKNGSNGQWEDIRMSLVKVKNFTNLKTQHAEVLKFVP